MNPMLSGGTLAAGAGRRTREHPSPGDDRGHTTASGGVARGRGVVRGDLELAQAGGELARVGGASVGVLGEAGGDRGLELGRAPALHARAQAGDLIVDVLVQDLGVGSAAREALAA